MDLTDSDVFHDVSLSETQKCYYKLKDLHSSYAMFWGQAGEEIKKKIAGRVQGKRIPFHLQFSFLILHSGKSRFMLYNQCKSEPAAL